MHDKSIARLEIEIEYLVAQLSRLRRRGWDGAGGHVGYANEERRLTLAIEGHRSLMDRLQDHADEMEERASLQVALERLDAPLAIEAAKAV